ncbi:MAG: RNA-binding S4 domain-containing protein [Planctomycetota bacterium]|nr:RNA-binding S4 domain-containing protein [Planctomycetota bacterium]MEC8431744.1 RNA-binding S4 domain-containing protein [Planctomycetota bacterium]
MNSLEPQGEAPFPLTLDQFIKLCGVVGTGGQAKQLIQGGEVLVNGEVETRRRKKLVPGDQVEVAGELFQVEIHEDPHPE